MKFNLRRLNPKINIIISKTRNSISTVASVLLLTSLAATDAVATDLRIDNVYLYQHQSMSFSPASRIYLDNGKIEKIEYLNKSATLADKIIDGQQRYIVPGLIDLHVHMSSSGGQYGDDYQHLPVQQNLNNNLYLGVTSVADLFSGDNIKQQIITSKQKNSTDVYFAGKLFTNKNGHGTQFDVKAFEIENDEDLDLAWQQHLASKPQITKAVIETFGGHGKTLTDQHLVEIGRRSKIAGLPFFVHISSLDDGKRAIKAGANVLAHGINSEVVDDEFIKLMQNNNVVYVPTLSVYHNQGKEAEDQFISKQAKLLATVHPKLQHCLLTNVQAPSGWMKNTWQKRALAKSNIVKLQKAGVTIGAGSDAGNPYVLHGAALHHEIQALYNAGLTAGQAINAATVNASRALNQNKIGTLYVGKQADLVLLSHNPLNNLSALSDIQQVYKQGNLVDRAKLKQENLAVEPKGNKCHQKVVSNKVAQRIIDDFSKEQKWQSFSDVMQGGSSVAETWLVETHNHDHQNNEQAHQRAIEVKLGKSAPFGNWAGAQLLFEMSVDISALQGVEITFSANKGQLFFALYDANVKDWDHFQKMIKATGKLQTIKIPFSQLKQTGFGKSLKWQGKFINGLNFVWRSFPNMPADKESKKIVLNTIKYY